jgi:hypothetical protein
MRFLRSMTALGCLGLTTFGLILPGCGSGVGQVTVQEVSSAHPHALPRMTVDRLRQCFADYGEQLGPGRYHFKPVVTVDPDGLKRGVETPDMPDTAPDLAACTRIVLGDMGIPSSIFNKRLAQSDASANAPTIEQRTQFGSPAVVVVVVVEVVVFKEILISIGTATILLAATVIVAAPPKTAAPPPSAPSSPSPPPDCPRNESFAPDHTDNATGCTDKKGNVRCYSEKHYPCAGVHTHGILHYQEIRREVCTEVAKQAIRCEGPFTVSGPCGSVSTTECKTGGPEVSGIFLR